MRMADLEDGHEVGAGVMHPEAHAPDCGYVFMVADTCDCGVLAKNENSG